MSDTTKVQAKLSYHRLEVSNTAQSTLHDGTLRSSFTIETETEYELVPKLDEDEEVKVESTSHNSNEIKIDNDNKDEEIKLNIPSSIILYTILDADQNITNKAMDKVNTDNPLNSVDPNWKYNLTLGDIQKRRITLDDGRIEELWFSIENSIRKVFIAFKIKRVSDVDNAAETYRMRFHMYFNWLATEDEYRSYSQAKQNRNLINWEPHWYPHLEFQNMIAEEKRYWEFYQREGHFRMQKFNDFAKEKHEIIPDHLFDCESARFLRAKLECEMVFSQELELRAFPFDCQNLSCIIHERTTDGVRCIFLPELRNPYFASIDPRYSVIDEWELECAILEFGDTDLRASRNKIPYAMIILRLKVKRRWMVYMWNIVYIMFCITGLALTSFVLHYEYIGERLNLLVTLALTAILFSYNAFETLPKVSYLTWMDKYILGSFVYIIVIMIESAFLEFIPFEVDYYLLLFSAFFLFLYQIFFLFYAYSLRKKEIQKLYVSNDQIEKELIASHPLFTFDFTKGLRSGYNFRLLSFLGMKPSEFLDKMAMEKIAKSQQRLEKIFHQGSAKLKESEYERNEELN